MPEDDVTHAAQQARDAVANLEATAANAVESNDAIDSALAELRERDTLLETTLGERVTDLEDGLEECQENQDVLAGDVQALETVQTFQTAELHRLHQQLSEFRMTNNSPNPTPPPEDTPIPSPEPSPEPTPEPSTPPTPESQGEDDHPAAPRAKPYRLI